MKCQSEPGAAAAAPDELPGKHGGGWAVSCRLSDGEFSHGFTRPFAVWAPRPLTFDQPAAIWRGGLLHGATDQLELFFSALEGPQCAVNIFSFYFDYFLAYQRQNRRQVRRVSSRLPRFFAHFSIFATRLLKDPPSTHPSQ